MFNLNELVEVRHTQAQHDDAFVICEKMLFFLVAARSHPMNGRLPCTIQSRNITSVFVLIFSSNFIYISVHGGIWGRIIIMVETAIDLIPLSRPEVGLCYKNECISLPSRQTTTARIYMCSFGGGYILTGICPRLG